MITGPLFKWFGSKWAASKHYPSPICDTVFEVFAGSAGYGLRHHSKKVVLWETNRNLYLLWCWLIYQATEAEIRSIPIGVPEGTDIRSLGISAGASLLMKHWQRTNNLGDCWTVSPWGNKPGQWTANTRARVAEEHTAVKHWQLRKIDGSEMGTYFIDPPYQYNYQYGVKDFDHNVIPMFLSNVPEGSQIIACEARCPKTNEAPKYLPFVDFRRTVTSRRKADEHHHSNELIYHGVVS